MISEFLELKKCGDCGVEPQNHHKSGCDVARCLGCGWQAISCGCPTPLEADWSESTERWTGLWPGTLECIEYGLYSYFIPGEGWIECAAGHPLAGPDLNRLTTVCRWDSILGKYVIH